MSRIALLGAALVTLALGGCGAISTRHGAAASSVGADSYLDTLNRLTSGAPEQQAEAFAAAEKDYNAQANSTNSLRYAIALTTSAHTAGNTVRGKKLLEKLLADPGRLTDGERNLAAFLLKDAEARLRLEAENRRLTATVDERTRNQANLDRRAQSLADENARLRKQLEEAQHKLDAIISIERSIIERRTKPGPAPRSDAPSREPEQTQSAPDGR